MANFSGLKGPSFLPELEGPGKLQLFRDKPDEDEDPGRRVIVTFGNRHAIRYDLEDNSVVAGYYCPTFLTLSTPLAYDSSIKSYLCGVNSGKQLIIWDGAEIKLENIINAENSCKEIENERNVNGKVITLEHDRAAVGIVALKSLSNVPESSECYVVLSNGELQTAKYLSEKLSHENKSESINSSKEEAILPIQSVRLDTSVFITEENDNFIYAAHAYNLDKTSHVRVCRLILDADTGRCRQTILHTVQLTGREEGLENLASSQKSNLANSSVTTLTLFGNFVTYVTADGGLIFLDVLKGESKKALDCMKKPSTSVDFFPVNLLPSNDQTLNLMALDELSSLEMFRSMIDLQMISFL